MLDASALVMVGIEGACARQARLTFAIARHAVVDLAQIFGTPPRLPKVDRLMPEDFSRLRARLAESGLQLREEGAVADRLAELRRLYEPYVDSLAAYLGLSIPPWMPKTYLKDNWQTSAWRQTAAPANPQPVEIPVEDHF